MRAYGPGGLTGILDGIDSAVVFHNRYAARIAHQHCDALTGARYFRRRVGRGFTRASIMS